MTASRSKTSKDEASNTFIYAVNSAACARRNSNSATEGGVTANVCRMQCGARSSLMASSALKHNRPLGLVPVRRIDNRLRLPKPIRAADHALLIGRVAYELCACGDP
jgi:hypothetical protein